MPRLKHSLAVLLALLLLAPAAWAQDHDDIDFEPDNVNKPKDKKNDTKGDGGGGDDDLTFDPVDPTKPVDNGDDLTLEPVFVKPENKISNADVVAVVHKAFLKQKRFEFLPQIGVTLNDNIIRHVQTNLQLNYYLTDTLALGVEGAFYFEDPRPALQLTGWQARRLPTVNKYNWSAAVNFHYVPIYGKFALFGKHLIQWETFLTVGFGVGQSEVIPRNVSNESFKNFLLMPNVGASFRFFIFKWLTVHVGIRDYMFLDKFEDRNRGLQRDGEMAKAEADSAFVNHIVFQAGISVWIPFSFEYTTFR